MQGRWLQCVAAPVCYRLMLQAVRMQKVLQQAGEAASMGDGAEGDSQGALCVARRAAGFDIAPARLIHRKPFPIPTASRYSGKPEPYLWPKPSGISQSTVRRASRRLFPAPSPCCPSAPSPMDANLLMRVDPTRLWQRQRQPPLRREPPGRQRCRSRPQATSYPGACTSPSARR